MSYQNSISITINNALVRSITKVILYSITIFSLMGCGSMYRAAMTTRAFFGGKVAVNVEIDPNANQNSPVAVDILFISDKNLLSNLLNMSSKDWFAKRDQIKRDYFENIELRSWSWEWVPGQKVTDLKCSLIPGAKGGVVFANYFTPGVHRFRINPFKDFKIHLLEKDMIVEQKK